MENCTTLEGNPFYNMGAEFRARHARLLELLRTHSYQEKPVILTSGRPSNFYIDCKQTVLTAEGHFLTGWLINCVLSVMAPTALAVGGLTMGADPLVSAASTLSFMGPRLIDAFYIRKEPKAHGTQRWIEGGKNLKPGSPVGILEDVITTGGSGCKAIERARVQQFDPVVFIALVDRMEDNGRQNVEAEGVPVVTLYSQRDFRTLDE